MSSPVVRAADMSEERQAQVLKMAEGASELGKEREVAHALKKQLDEELGGVWHVVVGRLFGSYVTHETGCFLYFYIGRVAYVVFR